MIPGFTEETKELTPNEIQMANLLVKGFNKHVTRQHAISSTGIIKALADKGIEMSGPRLRKMIHYIRVNRLAPRLIGDAAGYYIEPDDRKLARYIDTLFSRMFSVGEIIKSYRRDLPGHVDKIDREYISRLKYGA